jgi:hypothetical protein
MDAVDVAEWHQEDVAIAEADDLGQGGRFMPGRLDAAYFADGGHRTLSFDQQADELCDPPTILQGASVAHPV